ncbi:MAG: hypothetical protein HYX32_10990 [Actinobacteria bacterium]|nr:hypothetical protein [Actinomycetota bacterium]
MAKSKARGGVGVPEMLRGSVVTHRRRCGKLNCRCASGEELHESVVLSYSKNSRTRFVMLEPEEVEPVRAATERFRAARADLEAQAEANLAGLLARHSRTRRR